MRKLTKRKAALLGSSLLAVSALALAPGVLRNVPDIEALFARYQPALEQPKLTLRQPHFVLEPDAPDYLLSGSPHTLPAEPELAALVPDMPAWIAHPENLRRTSSPYYGGHAADGSPASTVVSRQIGSSGRAHGAASKPVDPLDTAAHGAPARTPVTPTIAANVPQNNVPQNRGDDANDKADDKPDAKPDVQPEPNPATQPESKPAPGAIAGDDTPADTSDPTTPDSGTEPTEPTQPTAGDTGPGETELAGLTPPPNELHDPVGGEDKPGQNPTPVVRVPEPGALGLLAVGIVGLLVCRRRA